MATCAWCGTSEQTTPITWTFTRERGRDQYLCDRCSRDNLRDIEARLDAASG